MANKIIFFDDLIDIFIRGKGYFLEDSEHSCGSIQVAFNDVFGKENTEWVLEFYTLKYCECSGGNTLHFIDSESIETQIFNSINGIDNVFVIMDAYWNESETIRDRIINALMSDQEKIYFCVYSTVSKDKIDEVKKQLEHCKYSKNTRIFMLDRADSGILYHECKNIFQNLELIVHDQKLWKENKDLTKDKDKNND